MFTNKSEGEFEALFGLFKRNKNVIEYPKVLIASIGTRFESDDIQIYEENFEQIETVRAADVQEFFNYLSGKTFDILHLFVQINQDNSISGSSGTEFFRHVTESNIKIFIFASDNLSERLIPFCTEGINSGYGKLNLVMTLERKERLFPSFIKELFDKMLGGITMPEAWVEIAPQGPMQQENIPETVFSAGLGSLKLTV
jgi:hypothetical protein